MLRAMDSPAVRRTVALLVTGALLAGCGATTSPSQSPTHAPSAAPTEASAKATPIVIDTDLDVSDVGAIAVLVVDPGVDVRAITITDAGTGVTKCGSARKVIGYLLDELGRGDIPYACGGADPGDDALPFPPEWRTAADTGWGMDIPPRSETGTPESAPDLLTRSVREALAPITIVALGPWTNIAAAAAADPALLAGVKGIHAMAASVDAPGNVFVNDLTADDRLEWNVVLDPSAFLILMQSSVPITLVPLDATQDVPVTENLKSRLGESAAGGANLVYELWVRVPGRIGEGQQLWDELAALAFVEPDLVTWQDITLIAAPSGRLDRGGAGREMHVAMLADAGAVDDAFVQALDRGGPRATPFALEGTISATWDGSSCVAQLSQPLAAGVAALEFTNTSQELAGVTILGVIGSHTWADLQAYVRTVDLQVPKQPDWLVLAGSAGDESGTGAVVRNTAIIEAGTYGPVCITGTWPDISISVGDSFDVAP
jgi:inosine-uridine nucleoside N-ribohydrolase